ncbi:MAG: patatin-like phospholipase family protein [Actinomycetota bacterium]|nr:patatin-like phospholipase family protein [Actinomycetota bacterium]
MSIFDRERDPASEQALEARRGERRIALCLSGGGYRAALFHLGALRRLDELKILSRVDAISTVSGGSILAALLLDSLRPWPQEGAKVDSFDAFAERVRDLTRKNIRTLWILKKLLPWNLFASAIGVRTLAGRYAKEIDDRPLRAMPKRPDFIFCATDMSFGVNWVHERRRIGDYQAGYLSPPPDNWTLSRAVAASSCFPPVFSPLAIELDPEDLEGGEARERADRDVLINRLRLSDGGVYDNMGLEPVFDPEASEPPILLVSDGGATFDFKPDRGFPSRLGRYLSVQSNQSGSLRKRWLIDAFKQGRMTGAYWGLGSTLSSYERTDGYPEALVDEVISEIRTDLDCFSEAERSVLENHGYLLADAAVQAHLPKLATKADLSIPHPDLLVEDEVERKLRNSSKRRLFGRWRWWPGS